MDALLYPKPQPPWLFPAGEMYLDLENPLTRGMQAYWPLRDDFRDYRGGYVGTAIGSQPSRVMTKFGPAMVLNGTNQAILTGLQLSYPSAWYGISVSAWLSPTNNLPTGPRVLSNDHTDVNHLGFQLAWNGSQWLWDVGAGGLAPSVTTTTGTNAAGVWTHLVGTYDANTSATQTIVIYKNGKAEGTATVNTNLSTPGFKVAIGYNPSYSGDFFGGIICNVAIWNRGLRAQEVARLYSEPFAMLRPIGVPVYYSQATAGASNRPRLIQ